MLAKGWGSEGRKTFWAPWCKKAKGFCYFRSPFWVSLTTTPNCSKEGLGKTGCLSKIQWETEHGQPGLRQAEEKITATVSIPTVHMGWDQIWLRKISNQHWSINSNFHYSKLSDRPGHWAHTLADPTKSQKQSCEVLLLQKEVFLEFMVSQTQRK